MAKISLEVQLEASHDPTDVLRLVVGSGHGLTLAESTPVGGILLAEQPIGPLADSDPPASVVLEGSHRPPSGCAVLALGVSVKDAAGNVSPLVETFEQIADHPRGVDTNPIKATANPNEALVSWTPSPDFEGAST